LLILFSSKSDDCPTLNLVTLEILRKKS